MKMSTRRTTAALALTIGLLLATPAMAAITFEDDGTVAANLTKITIDGTEYTSFIGVDLTGFSEGKAAFQILASDEAGTPRSGTAAPTIVEDSSLVTCLPNADAMSFAFLAPVVNVAGPEIFLFDWRAPESNSLDLTINGVTTAVSSWADTGLDGVAGAGAGASADTDPTGSLHNLIDTTWTSSDSDQGSHGINDHAVDLSDFGVVDGGTVTSLSFSDNGGVDIAGVVAVPEPATLSLVGLGGLVALRRRRS
jgi:hypothetical protein